jgi:UDP-GlcNAc:undecaprenyl-phosphate GlcNAc-1-phosphate transferase
MIRFAPRLGMIDAPDPRKVHRAPIARVGGIGIAAGALIALLLLAPMSTFNVAFLCGSIILAGFGAWDDAHELSHYPKFIGQLAAASLMVWYGGLWIEQMPFFTSPMPGWFGKPFTVVALVGVINAINHSDGLDGLAGGEVLLSIGAISCLAYLTGNTSYLVLAAAVGGGLLGFVRYNTYPATVFMGDLGSQFLGFSVGVLAISLTQQGSPTLSKSLALMLVGLPVIDILAVLYQRIRGGMNWFCATRNHIHHRLLDLGFDHYLAVLVIYSAQAGMTFAALALPYESEALILGLYVGAAVLAFTALTVAERRGWRVRHTRPSLPTRLVMLTTRSSAVARGPLLFVQIAVPAFLVLTSLGIHGDPAVASIRIWTLALIGLLVLFMALGVRRSPGMYRLALYSAIGMISYCIYNSLPSLNPVGAVAFLAAVLLLAVAVALCATLGRTTGFSVTNMDFLIVIGLIIASFFAHDVEGAGNFWMVAIATTVVFYGCELIILRGNSIWNRILSTSAVGALGILLGKALI